jgi:hypothetical protein
MMFLTSLATMLGLAIASPLAELHPQKVRGTVDAEDHTQKKH